MQDVVRPFWFQTRYALICLLTELPLGWPHPNFAFTFENQKVRLVIDISNVSCIHLLFPTCTPLHFEGQPYKRKRSASITRTLFVCIYGSCQQSV